MLGLIFTELVEMVEARFSPELADELLDEAGFAHGGAYTAVGYYDHTEILTLVQLLAQKTNIPITELIQEFGCYLFESFTRSHSRLLANKHSLLNLLATLESEIHKEVRKLYSEARLPSFRVLNQFENGIDLEYRSERHLETLAIGLITGAARFYGHDHIRIDTEPAADATIIRVRI